ncbi:hypothetical protein BSPLISOX_2772 [uncultured Gammaproteobacteria bacterium]|nr:hypothetical protein BSPLISOX_2772 [uncultured Gammaproteobacteria bacterium]
MIAVLFAASYFDVNYITIILEVLYNYNSIIPTRMLSAFSITFIIV